VLDLAKHLDLSVVAEGRRDRRTARYLESRGCDYVQGYLTGKPMSAHVAWPP
jgi:EAL domain-containing protein (putative c-di-GMP-specific phosphodiesterase class I)